LLQGDISAVIDGQMRCHDKLLLAEFLIKSIENEMGMNII